MNQIIHNNIFEDESLDSLPPPKIPKINCTNASELHFHDTPLTTSTPISEEAKILDSVHLNKLSPLKIRKIFSTASDYREKPPHQKENKDSTEIIVLLNEIIQNQRTLLQDVANIKENVKNIEEKINANGLEKNEIMAQSSVARESLIINKQILKTTKRLVGEEMDDTEIQITSLLPLASVTHISDLEELMKTDKFSNTLVQCV